MILVLLAGCQQSQSGREVRVPAPLCFKQLKRPAAGRLVLRQPISCDEPVSRYRVEGHLELPARVVHLDPDGKTRLTYRVQYDQKKMRPILEERVYHTKPPSFRVKGRNDRVVVGGTLGSDWKTLTIRTKLDQRGRPLEVEKFVGAERAYRVVREYQGDRLKSESTYDGGGRLKYRTDYIQIDGRPAERMVDGAGKVLMERMLDTSGVPPVHNPEIE
jgi:hypothetical protein